MPNLIQLVDQQDYQGLRARVNLDNGQLVSLTRHDIEFLWGGGKPEHAKTAFERNPHGWRNSEIAMFPIVGPAAGFMIQVGNVSYPMDQHGIARNIRTCPIQLGGLDTSSVTLIQEYEENSPVDNLKAGDSKPNPKALRWPFSFKLEKEILIEGPNLTVTFYITNTSDSPTSMPYQFGWHPAFLSGNLDYCLFRVDEARIAALKDVVAASSLPPGSMPIRNLRKLEYINTVTGYGAKIEAWGFDNMMLWSPHTEAGMFCIEPVTHLPDSQLVRHFARDVSYRLLEQGKTDTYIVLISPFRA